MTNVEGLTQAQLDQHFLRHSFDVARRSMTNGNHPFGAILVGQNRKVLIETENGYMPAHDGTAHAERLLATEACRTLKADVLTEATIYSSAEPCAMCAGAIYWAGIGRGDTAITLGCITSRHRPIPSRSRNGSIAMSFSRAAISPRITQ